MSSGSRALLLFIVAPCLLGLLSACFAPVGQTGATTGEPTTTGDIGPTLGTTGTTVDPTAASTVAPTVTTDETVTTDATVTSLMPTTGDACGVCPETAPYCAPDGECVACDGLVAHGSSCEQLDPSRPLCDRDGTCVGCHLGTDCPTGNCDPVLKQCSDCDAAADCPGNLACDLDTHTCVLCDEHSDCPDSACELDLGTCFPPGAHHWYVSGDTSVCEGTTCSPDVPCCEIQHALTTLASSPEAYHVVHVTAGDYIEPLRLSAAKRVAVLAPNKTSLAAELVGKPLILVGDAGVDTPLDAKLYLTRLQLGGAGDAAVSCAKAKVAWLDDVAVLQFAGSSVYATACNTTVRRSRFIGNGGGLTAAADGLLQVENSVVSAVTTAPSLTVLLGGALELDYTTVALQNPVPDGLLWCPAQGSVSIRNSAVISGQSAGDVNCPATIAIVTSVTSADKLLLVPGVESVPADQAAMNFVDWAASDLRPVEGGELAGVAVWQASDPATDLAGAPRPTMPGSPDYAGAYLPPAP